MITPRCAAAPSLHLQKGSTCITGSATQSAYHYQPPSPDFSLQRSNRSLLELIRFVDLASATSDEIEQLSAACDPATFGRGDEDVYDETYRKAVKMDASDFAVQFDPVRAGLIEIIEKQLLSSSQEGKMSINTEIYKLNVYGGSCSDTLA